MHIKTVDLDKSMAIERKSIHKKKKENAFAKSGF